MVEYTEKINGMTVVFHLCGNHSMSRPVSTPAVLLQSLIMQVIQQHLQVFTQSSLSFTLDHFQDVQDDVGGLLELFSRCCVECGASCVWIVLDHLDNLQKGEDYDYLVQGLLKLSDNNSRVHKIFVSARSSGTHMAVLEAADMHAANEHESSPSIAAVNVPKAPSKMAATLLSRQKRLTRLPDSTVQSTATKADIEYLLHSSSSEDELLPEDEDQQHSIVASPTSLTSPKQTRHSDMTDDSTASDSSMEFTRDDPFESSEDSDSDLEHHEDNPASSEDDDLFRIDDPDKKDSSQNSDSDDDLWLVQSPKANARSRGRSETDKSIGNRTPIPALHSEDDAD